MHNKSINTVWGLFIFATLLFIFGPLLAGAWPGGYKPDELVCKMQPGSDIEVINMTYGTTIKNQLQETHCYLLRVQSGTDAESLAVVINARPDVIYCRPNFYLAAPEPYQRSQPFLDLNAVGDFELQMAAVTLDLAAVQEITVGTDEKIAVIDGGVDFYFPLFDTGSAEVLSGWDYVDDDAVAFDEPGGACSGHGTFVAGVLRLVAPEATIISYRVLDTTGEGDGYNIAAAVLQAISDSCCAINLSLGMVGDNDALDDALQFARENDVVVVAAAGNDSSGNNLTFPFPASRMNSIAVAALDSMNLKADFSNYGEKVDICAPGTGIYAPYTEDLYGWWDGTSFSTPFITGLVALMHSINPELDWVDFHNIIRQTATDVDSLNPDYAGLLGGGLVNMTDALDKAVPFIGGDANRDRELNIFDITYIIDYLYLGESAPLPFDVADVDLNGVINIFDIAYMISFLYLDGPAPLN
jgi:hypothetical protein